MIKGFAKSLKKMGQHSLPIVAVGVFVLVNTSVLYAQLDLKSLIEKGTKALSVQTDKEKEKQNISTKESFFAEILTLLKENADYPSFRVGPEDDTKAAIKNILEHDYNVKMTINNYKDEGCYRWIYSAINQTLSSIYYYHLNSKADLAQSTSVDWKKNIVKNSNLIKEKAKNCGVENQTEKIISFVYEFNDILSENIKKYNAQKNIEIEKMKTQQAKRDKIEAEKREEMKKNTQKKIDEIIAYADNNQNRLLREFKSFCKEISGVWFSKGDYFALDLSSTKKAITMNNNPPLPLGIAKFKENRNYIVMYTTKNGKIVPDEHGKLFGFIIEKVPVGGNEFRLKITLTDGIEVGATTMLNFLRNFK